MPVVPLIEEKDAPPDARAAYEDIEAHFGTVLDCFKALAHKPGSVEPVWKLHKELMFEGELDPALRELAVIKICALNHAGY
ncbi:MAG: hypothetical protein L0G70_06810 [Rubrobacter sp.]|nr:hypothetical protein [Rubrobacter sp.]